MSLQQLKTVAEALSDGERRELIGYLIRLGRARPPEYWDRLAAKVADNDPNHWATEEQLDGRLGLDPTSA